MSSDKRPYGIPGPGEPRPGWMTFVASGPVNVERLRPIDVDIRDICRGLGAINRYLGQTVRPMPVLWHSLLAAEYLAQQPGPLHPVVLAGLLHDAGEVYVGDWVRPVKHLVSPELRALKDNVQHTVFRAAGIGPLGAELTARIHEADDVLIRWEIESPWGSGHEVRWYARLSDNEIEQVERAVGKVGPPPAGPNGLQQLETRFMARVRELLPPGATLGQKVV